MDAPLGVACRSFLTRCSRCSARRIYPSVTGFFAKEATRCHDPLYPDAALASSFLTLGAKRSLKIRTRPLAALPLRTRNCIRGRSMSLVLSCVASEIGSPQASELWVASQRAMPDWARGRMNATMVMVAQAATALGGVIWGLAAHHAGVVPTFLGAAVFALVLMIVVRVVPALQISIDFTKSLSFESAPVSIFSQNLDPGRLLAPQDGPVSITAEFNVDPTRRDECIELMRDARMIFLRNGANRWHLYGDLHQPNLIRMEVVVPSWKQHLLQRERRSSPDAR